jgi:AbiU2
MSPMTQASLRPDDLFKYELEVFRKEEEVAQQYFFSWLQIRTEFATDEQLLDRINDTPLFWITTHHALLLAAFVALGRVFDQGSRHNVDALLRLGSNHRDIFTRAALKERRIREGSNPEFAAAYASDKYEPTAKDFRELRAEVDKHRKVYVARFRDVRDKIYAHKELSDHDAMNELLAKATIDELKAIFGFLHALHEALWELLHNGRRPILRLPDFELPPIPATCGHNPTPGEIVAREAAEFFAAFMAAQGRRERQQE